ncbi:hypothetical protein ACGFNU_21295 [Spirillospora sp. NPDC048911]|uniref:phage tail termination protein n=1 Tax=Spirillospora sp. NPDC048911 TaxID=3364527 RepID=UPI0037221FDC
MPVLASFPSAERIIAAVVDDLGEVGAETSTTLQDDLPFIRVRRIGGADDQVTDIARVDVRVYAADLSGAKALAETIRQRLISGPSATADGVLDRAATEVGPQEVPGPDPDHYRVVSTTYRVSVRRR